MKTKLILSLSIFLISGVIKASEGTYYCESSKWTPYKTFKKAYIKTSGCEKASSWWSNPYQTAVEDCQKWAKGLGINQFYTVYFSDTKYENHNDECMKKSYNIDAELKKQKMNEVVAFTYDKKNEYAGGSSFIWSNLYVDTTLNEQTLFHQDGTEQAQWIKRNNQFYCGLYTKDLGFRVNENKLEVIRLSTLDKGIYLRTKTFNLYKESMPLSGINGNFILINPVQAGTSSIQIMQDHDLIDYFKIYYSESSSECR